MLAQRITAIAPGYGDLNDHQALRADPVLQVAAATTPDADSPLASPPTLCRLEDRVDRKALVRIAGALVDPSLAAHPAPPGHPILGFDATDDPIHGRQERRFFHGSYDHHCFLPLYVFRGDESLTAYLRPGDIDAARHTRAVLKLLARKPRRAWPGVEITIRGGSGFCRRRLMRRCDSHGIGYILGLARNPALRRDARDEIDRAERQSRRAGRPRRIFGSFSHAAGSWGRARRAIVKAEHNAQGANPRFVVANVPGDPQEFYEDVYCQRGEMENRIKEQQLGLFADRTGCHRFAANPFRLLLSSASYVRVQALRRTALEGTERARARAGTIRSTLFKVAARVVVSVRRVMFHRSSSYPYQAVFREVFQRLTSDPACGPVASGRADRDGGRGIGPGMGAGGKVRAEGPESRLGCQESARNRSRNECLLLAEGRMKYPG